MKSLRQQLALGLLLAFSLLLGVGGVAVYFSVRSTLARQFDDALLAKAVTIASSVKADKGSIESHFSEQVAHGISAPNEVGFFQLWEVDGDILNRSRSLGKNELPKEFSSSSTPRFFDLKLPGGVNARGVGLRFSPVDENETSSESNGDEDDKNHSAMEEKYKPPQLGLVVAADWSKLNLTLNTLILIVALADGLTLLAAMLSVHFVLRRGLQPLNRLAEQTRHVGVDSLEMRFPADGMPVELMPISERLNDLLSRLEKSFAEMSEYASKVTHELRTPLAILRLKLEQSAGKIQPDLAEELQAEIHQLVHVVEQSLVIAKAEQGRLKLQPREFNLGEMLADVAEDFSLLGDEENRRVIVTNRSAEITVCLDPKSTRQIIHNLLSNALKHGRSDIHVRLLSARGCSQLTVINRTRADANAVETLGLGLRVVDSLLQLQPEIKFCRRAGQHYYATRLIIPQAARQDSEPINAAPISSIKAS